MYDAQNQARGPPATQFVDLLLGISPSRCLYFSILAFTCSFSSSSFCFLSIKFYSSSLHYILFWLILLYSSGIFSSYSIPSASL